jgi:hypothetical protein
MKTLAISLLLFIGCLLSCTKEEVKKEPNGYPQKWELVKMTGSMINIETTGAEMSWQEFYVFHEDGTFIKSREQEGNVLEASGTYSYSNKPDEQFILITYQTGLNLKASCLADPSQERLNIISPEKLVGTWNICDGPILEYKLVGCYQPR